MAIPDNVKSASDLKILLSSQAKEGIDFNRALLDSKECPKYIIETIPKRSGGYRTLYKPNPDLLKIQKILSSLLSAHYTPPNSVSGAKKGSKKGVRENALMHIGASHVLKIDIKDFYPSIKKYRIKGLLLSIFAGKDADFYSLLVEIISHEGILPQGSPASPVIANMIMFRLDNRLHNISRSYKLNYSRYADDITISSNKRSIPAVLAFCQVDSNSHKEITVLGKRLSKIFEDNGFEINDKKLRLIKYHQRIEITGVVVNEKPNLRTGYVKQVRTMIKTLESSDTLDQGYRKLYILNYSKPIDKVSQSDMIYIKHHLFGRMNYIRHVKGNNDRTYRTLAGRLSSVDKDFVFTESDLDLSNITIHLRVEGSTDKRHIETALFSMKRKGLFLNLNVAISEPKEGKGAETLYSDMESDKRRNLNSDRLNVYLFDGDFKKAAESIKSKPKQKNRADKNTKGDDFKSIAPHIYSMILPDTDGLPSCIEMLYGMNQIKTLKTPEGRRLFFRSEFDDKTGWHKSEDVVLTNRSDDQSSIIVDTHVYNKDRSPASINKGAFSYLVVKSPEDIDFSGFIPIFSNLEKIRYEYYNKVVK